MGNASPFETAKFDEERLHGLIEFDETNPTTRLQSERTALEEDLARSRASAEEWQGRWTALNDQHTAVVAQVNCNEFTVEHFERLRRHESMLRQQLDTFQERHRALERDNRCLRKSADKWRAKFQNQKSVHSIYPSLSRNLVT